MTTSISPLPTAFALTLDALESGRPGVPALWHRAVASRLRARDATTLAPLIQRRTTGWPAVLEDGGHGRESLDEALQRILATSGEAILDALEGDPDITLTPAWDPVRRHPKRWLSAYVDAIVRAWKELEPLWKRSTTLLERDAERIDAALERGVPASQILVELLPRTALVAEVEPLRARIARRLNGASSLVLAPAVIETRAAVTYSAPARRLARLTFPLREARRTFDCTAPPAALEALVGVPRAALLRYLDHPRPAGELAAILYLTPAAITFHLRALEAAGLIVRERRGRRVIVHRSARGVDLLALYD